MRPMKTEPTAWSDEKGSPSDGLSLSVEGEVPLSQRGSVQVSEHLVQYKQ